jgi:UTP--glucose-1-phosphate uridylyltransferase
MQTKVRKGVIVAAGLGTRFLPITKSIPKEMLPVGNKPGLQLIVEEMANSGIEEIILVISKDKKAIKHYFTPDKKFEQRLQKLCKPELIQGLVDLLKQVKIYFAYQNKPLGNGDAILCAKKFIKNEPFACADADGIIAGDVPATKQLLDTFYTKHAPLIGVQKLTDKQAMTKYGNVYGDPAGEGVYRVSKFEEKPSVESVSPHGLIVGGMRYVFTPDVWQELEACGKGRGGEIWAADAANNLAKKRPFYALVYQGKYLDTGRVESWLKTNEYFLKK